MLRPASIALALSLGSFAAAGSSDAQLLVNDTEASQLIDVTSGTPAPYGTHFIPGNVVGLTYQASTGAVYGIANGPNPAFNGIYLFNPADGSAQLATITELEPHPIDLVSALAAPPDENVLYALQTGSVTRSALWRIDLDTSTYTQLTIDFPPFMTALTFAPDGRLLAGSANFLTNLGALYEIDLQTITAVPLHASPALRMTGLTIDAETGDLVGTFNGFGDINTVFRIDEATGATTPMLSSTDGVWNAVVSVPDDTVTADLDGNGAVDFDDLVLLLSAWGPCPAGDPCIADLTRDGIVGLDDLVALLAEWS